MSRKKSIEQLAQLSLNSGLKLNVEKLGKSRIREKISKSDVDIVLGVYESLCKLTHEAMKEIL